MRLTHFTMINRSRLRKINRWIN